MYYDITASGNRIRELRIQKGLTQEQLSDLIYCSRTAVTLLETGQNGCSVQVLIQLALALDTTIDYIVMGRKEEFPEREIVNDRLSGMIEEIQNIKDLLKGNVSRTNMDVSVWD